MADHEAKNFFFTPNQKRIIASGITILALLFLLSSLYVLFWLLQSFVSTFQDVLMPLTIAGVLALLLRPTVQLFEQKLKLGRIPSIVFLYALMGLTLVALGLVLLPPLSKQAIGLVDYAPNFVNDAQSFLNERFPGLVNAIEDAVGKQKFETGLNQLSGSLKEALSQLFSSLSQVGKQVSSMLGTVAAYAVIPIYLFYFLGSRRHYGDDLEKGLSFMKEGWRSDLVFLIEQFAAILVAFFRGQLVIGMILGVFLATGFSLVGLQFGLVLGGLIGILNIIPYLGTMIGVAVVLPLAYFQVGGGWTLIGLCAAVFIVGQCLSDYCLTPRIMGKETGMNPMLIIVSIFFWGTALNGLLGMILAIPLTAFFLIFWRLLQQKYFRPSPAAQGS